MRIICPNCSVQYEIADDLIPSNGREVQCSNCGRTWYQDGASVVPAAGSPAPDDAGGGPAVDEVDGAADPDDDPAEDEDLLDGEADRADEATDRDEMSSLRPRPSANEAILRVLREERDHEAQRRATSTRPKAPPDAPPADAARERAAAERRRMAAAAEHARTREAATMRPGLSNRKRADAAPTMDDAVRSDPDARPRAATEPRIMRRELLPDIEEINSSLRPYETEAKADGDTAGHEEPGTSTGFWGGFLTVCVLVGLFVGAYVFADELAARVPETADPLTAYVAWIDGQRTALAHWVEALTDRLLSET